MLPPHATAGLGLASGQHVQVEGDAVQTPVNVVYLRVRLSRGGKVLLRDYPPAGSPPPHQAGPHPGALSDPELNATGLLAALLAGPDGRIMGLVLADGRVAGVAPEESLDFSGLSKGARLQVAGRGTVRDGVASIRLERLTLPDGTERTIRPVDPTAVRR